MAEPNATPQQALKKAQRDLAVALRGALQALENPGATPGLMGVAMQALQSAQVGWNQAVSRIPLEVMTDGELLKDIGAPEDTQAEPEVTPFAELSKSENPYKWADTFLAVNRNQAVTRELLAGWFESAINVRATG